MNCGTYSGFQAHKRRGELPCDPCRLARNEYVKWYRRNRGLTKASLVPITDTCGNCGHHLAA